MPEISKRFLSTIDKLILIEGPYNETKGDKGGATKYGISKRFLQQLVNTNEMYRKAFGPTVTNDVIRNLTISDAEFIYANEYWQKHDLDKMVWPVSFMYMSYLINMRPATAAKVLQRAIKRVSGIGIAVDGVVGPRTLFAMRQCNVEELCIRFEAEASAQYVRFNDYNLFGDGWHYRSAWTLWQASKLIEP